MQDEPQGPGECRAGELLFSQARYETLLGAAGGRAVKTTAVDRKGDLLIALYESQPYDLKVPAMDTPRLSINLMSAAVHGGLAGDRERAFAGERYSGFLTPAQSDAHWVKVRPSRHFNIYFDEGLIEELGGGCRAIHDCRRPMLGRDLRRQRAVIDALHRACRLPAARAEEASLGLAYLLLAEVLLETRTPPTLGAVQLRLVKDYIRDNLGHAIRVSDLAALAGLPAPQFTLAFRNSLGCTPHRFLMRQRLGTAIRLLRRTAIPISEVAMTCGFSSQQHLTTAMRQMTGRTPGSFR